MPFVYLKSFSFDGKLELVSSCKLAQLKNPEKLLQTAFILNDIEYPNVGVQIDLRDSDSPANREIPRYNISVESMESRSVTFLVSFLNPQIVSSGDAGYDYINFRLFTTRLLSC